MSFLNSETVSAKRQIFVFDVFILLLLAVSCLSFGLGPLVDLDFGWHLATGLWSVENKAVPTKDFLGPTESLWIAYSWLFEVLMAQVYKWSGFPGLQTSQYLLIFFSISILYISLIKRREDASSHVLAALLVIFAIPLLAPFWHLRPQLLSAALFTIVLATVQTKRGPTLGLIPLTIFWSNMHVFWIFAPMLAAAFSSTWRKAVCSLLLLLCGLASPYVVSNFSVINQYAFKHGTGYSLIEEFLPLGPAAGLFFWWWLAHCFVFVCSAPRLLRRGEWRLAVMGIAVALLSFLQRKYLPYFATTVTFAFFSAYVGTFTVAIKAGRSWYLAAGLSLAGSVLYFSTWGKPAPLTEEIQQLLSLTSQVGASHTKNAIVLNEFNDGGWIGLGLYLARQKGEKESKLKVSIDGRTLVSGGLRLNQFRQLQETGKDACRIIELWGPSLAILKSDSSIRRSLENCSQSWQLAIEKGNWMMFEKIQR